MAGLYIHIPFCHSKCAYCDFYSMADRSNETRLIDSLIKELHARRSEISDITTIYIGGGTPSSLTDASLRQLMEALPVDKSEETTIEANPDDITPERVKMWKDIGINRASMGVQSWNDYELKILGRRHDSGQAAYACETLSKYMSDNFSIDLMYGLPSQTIESWCKSLKKTMELSPAHFSAYILSFEPRTRLTAMLKTGKIQAPDEETVVEMYSRLIDIARSCGYEHYEISNFAKPGKRAIHNSNYWRDIPYLGLGPSAYSFDGKTRRVNVSNLKDYLGKTEAGIPAYEEEAENATDIFNNQLITALRTADGLDFAKIPRRRRQKFLCDAYRYLKRDEITINDNKVKIPEKDWLISDAIFRDLMQ